MLTLSQILLVIVVTVLTILVIIFSLYIFRILNELRITMQKTNAIMDDMKRISKSVADPIEHASEFVAGLKQGGKLVELAGRFVERKTDGSKHKKSD